MSEEIKQVIGFDAAQALKTLQDLDRVMEQFEQRLGASVKAMNAFNQRGGKTVAALKQLATEGKKAADALQKVADLQGTVARSGAGGTGGGQALGGVSPASGVEDYVKQLQRMYSVAEGATTAQKRSFQSAISSAAEFAAKNKVSIGQVIAQSRHLEKSFTGTANTMANRLAKIEQASKRHLNAAGQQVRRLTVDFQTMVRIVTTQAIVRALSLVRTSIKATASDAVDFQRRVAEIGTIAPTKDLEHLGAVVRSISDEFNTPLDTTAEAFYQTISNQIGSTVQDFESFAESAARFSKVAVTDLDTSVNLLSGTLNAFDKDVSQTEDVAAKFFKTIELGRTRAEQLAQGYGTVAPIAARLGVSMEELNAAVATLTISGIGTDKAFTQIRGTMQAFLKPTTDMKKALRELGFASGEQLLLAYDLAEAIEEVTGTTDGSAASIAKLFPRIRGLTGVMTLLADEGEHFNRVLAEQGAKLQENYGQAYHLVMETDAEKVTKQLNKLHNYLVTEFGQAVLQAAGQMLQTAGGADRLIRVLESLAPMLPPLALGLGAVGAALAAMALKARLAVAGLSGLAGPIGAVGAAFGAAAFGKFMGKEIVDSWGHEYREFQQLMEGQLKARKGKIDQEIAAERQKAAQLEQLLERGFAKARQTYFKEAEAAAASNKGILAEVRYYTGEIIRQRQRAAQAYQNQVQNLQKTVQASENRAYKTRLALEDKLFARQIQQYEARHQFSRLLERANDLAYDAAKKLAGAATEDQRATASEEFQRAQAFVDQALAIADQTNNRGMEQQAVRALESITGRLVRSEASYQQKVIASKEALIRRAKDEEKRVEELKKKQKELLKAFTLYDQQSGELLSGQRRVKKLQDAQKKLRQFIELATRGQPLDVTGMVSFANLSAQLARQMDAFRIEELKVSQRALQGLHRQIQESLSRMYAEIPAARVTKDLTGVEATGPATETSAKQKVIDDYRRLVDLQGEYQKADEDVAAAEQELSKALQITAGNLSDLGVGFAGMIAKSKELLGDDSGVHAFRQMGEAIRFIQRAAEDTSVTLDEFLQVRQKLIEAEQDQSFGESLLGGQLKQNLADALNALLRLMEARQRYKEIQQSGISEQDIQTRLPQYEQAREFLEQPKLDALQIDQSLGNSQASIQGSVSPLSQMAGYWSSIRQDAEATASAAMLASGAPPAMAARGGLMRYFASGGFGRGMDRIPAMLSPGEFVVNARSSRQFFSQLQAINAGQQPVYRETGGSTTNIGDVNITVKQSGSPKATAREVMAAFRREMRRGSSRL